MKIYEEWRKQVILVLGPHFGDDLHTYPEHVWCAYANMARVRMRDFASIFGFSPRKKNYDSRQHKGMKGNQSNQMWHFSTLETRLKLNLNKLCKFNLYFL
jgi:hypothetical protein